MENNSIFETIKSTIDNNNVVLFMKGTKQSPLCGFSAAVVDILDNLGVDFHDVNVLKDANIREAIKQYSDWPTIPQLYIKGQFIGGCDITREMNDSGELQELLKENNLI